MKTGLRSHPKINALSLIECLIYIAVLSVLLGIGYQGLSQLFTESARLRSNSSDMIAITHLGELWRDDVRRAGQRPLLLHELEITNGLEIVRSDRKVLYSHVGSSLYRLASADVPPYPALTNVKSSQFFLEQNQGIPVMRWEVELHSRNKKSKLRPLFSFQAVLPKEANL